MAFVHSSLLPIDVGFDIKALKMHVTFTPGVRSVAYINEAGNAAVVSGSRAAIRRALHKAGYVIPNQLECLRCGWSWEQRGAEKPATCPGCRSPYWETVRTRPEAPPIVAEFTEIDRAIGALQALKVDFAEGSYKLKRIKAHLGGQSLKIEVSWV